MDKEASVLERYSEGAKEQQPELCCPVDYDASLLKLLPEEIIEKDYGCGDPSRYVREGDTVLDLGSGSGKICYMAAQLVGEKGKVIGVDMNDDMLGLAKKYQNEMAGKIGTDRVEFVKGQIQDLAVDLEAMDQYLAKNPVKDFMAASELRVWQEQQKKNDPLIKNNTIDLVVSNCVLNLVHDSEKQQLIEEIFRVTKPGGRVAISDIVSDEDSSEQMKNDPELWSGCISGALAEDDFLQAFVDAGFVAVSLDKWGDEPWQVVEGIEFRTVTITASKPEAVDCLDYGHAVIYKGPFKEVYDDEGHVYPRGKRIAVCERSFDLLTGGFYGDQFIGITPTVKTEPRNWCHPAGTLRMPAETKGGSHSGGVSEASCC
ncbi:MAG: methyltransferase domain-containing protein [Gammaproteobacteria bacterium]